MYFVVFLRFWLQSAQQEEIKKIAQRRADAEKRLADRDKESKRVAQLEALISSPRTSVVPAANEVELHPFLRKDALAAFCRHWITASERFCCGNIRPSGSSTRVSP